MKLSPSDSTAKYRIQTYSDNAISLNNVSYTQSLIITPQQIISPWEINHFQKLSLQNFIDVAPLDGEIWLLGTGLKHHFPDPRIVQFANKHRIGLETMTTPAACRTFNLLLSEDRQVSAFLIIENEQ